MECCKLCTNKMLTKRHPTSSPCYLFMSIILIQVINCTLFKSDVNILGNCIRNKLKCSMRKFMGDCYR